LRDLIEAGVIGWVVLGILFFDYVAAVVGGFADWDGLSQVFLRRRIRELFSIDGGLGVGCERVVWGGHGDLLWGEMQETRRVSAG
jgi:hypothetical protein